MCVHVLLCAGTHMGMCMCAGTQMGLPAMLHTFHALPELSWEHHETVHGHLLAAGDGPPVLRERTLPEEQH